MSDFIPNSFQVPNAYIDRVWHLLTPPEQSVLIYMARRIFGFNKREDRIAMSQFTGGKRSKKDGANLDGGTGLCEAAIDRAISGLVEFGLVEVLDGALARERLGPLYTLQLDSSKVDVAGLAERKRDKRDKGRSRTETAREVAQQNNLPVPQVGTPPCPTDPYLPVGQGHNKQGETQGFSINKESISYLESNSSSCNYNDPLFGEDEL